MTGPNPTDRGKLGSKIHLVVDRAGLPVSVAISAANTHDSLALQPLVMGIPPVRSRRGPRRRRPEKLHGDKGYDYPYLRRWLRERGITPRIARRGIESDALATAVSVLDPEVGMKLIDETAGAAALVVIEQNGREHTHRSQRFPQAP